MVAIYPYIPEGYKAKWSDTSCALVDKKGNFYQLSIMELDNNLIIPSTRVQLEYKTDRIVYKNPDDQLFVDKFFDKPAELYNSYLLEAINDIHNTLQSIATRQNYSAIYVHKYCYRINQENNYFNILVEWCGLVPNKPVNYGNFRK